MSNANPITTFILGSLLGLLGGFLLGAFLGKSVFQLASFLINLIGRQRTNDDRMKFELLLQ